MNHQNSTFITALCSHYVTSICSQCCSTSPKIRTRLLNLTDLSKPTTKTRFHTHVYSLGHRIALVPSSGITYLGYCSSWFLSRWHPFTLGTRHYWFFPHRYQFKSVRTVPVLVSICTDLTCVISELST